MSLVASATLTQAHTIEHHDVIPHIKLPNVEFTTVTGNRLVLGKKDGKIHAVNTLPVTRVASTSPLSPLISSPTLTLMRKTFGSFSRVKTHSDGKYFYIESDGIPDHPMMAGIRAWNTRVPLPQKYSDANAFQVPLHPIPAKTPILAKDSFYSGAIAIAANGISIFNPLKNNGAADTYLLGELDQWGGHAGRADDYHYHIPPVHLQDAVGAGNPIAFAFDGYPIYGFTEPDGSPVTGLDQLNGHKDAKGNYHYHSTKTYPYLNGGFYGQVTVENHRLIPQPRAGSPRNDNLGIRKAAIAGFSGDLKNGFQLAYTQNGRKGQIFYRVNADGSAYFRYLDFNGQTREQTYQPRNGGQRPPRGQVNGRRPRGKAGGRPPRPGQKPRRPR